MPEITLNKFGTDNPILRVRLIPAKITLEEIDGYLFCVDAKNDGLLWDTLIKIPINKESVAKLAEMVNATIV